MLRFAFYPRPPDGGRLLVITHLKWVVGISIHALRVKATQPCSAPAFLSRFLSTLFGWRAICCPPKRTVFHQDFYPRPPGGGRPSSAISNILSGVFLSTPSGWRATRSILSGSKVSVFLSTPSGWRATSALQPQCTFTVFLSTPSGWRATWEIAAAMKMYNISIHALRVEGDESLSRSLSARARFLSTPSGWRATLSARAYSNNTVTFLSTPSGWRATSSTQHSTQHRVYFYPRPPGGGRRERHAGYNIKPEISIHALRVEGDVDRRAVDSIPQGISIHALRVEGDRPCRKKSA